MKKLLITDSFFIFDRHVLQLESAGYEVERLDTATPTEGQLVEAIKGVDIYILGAGQVTEAVVAAADKLKAIIFTGVDYDNFVPAADAARAKGIQLLNAPGANAEAVAEFTVGMAIALQRDLFGIGRTGDKKYLTTSSIQNSVVGLMGAGHIGQLILDSAAAFKPKEVLYFNRSSKDIAATQVEIDELVERSDIIFLTLPKKAGLVLDADRIAKLKTGCLIVSISPMNLIDFDALLPRLQAGEVRCAVDWPAPSAEFESLPFDVWFSVNSHAAYNTKAAIDAVSDSVTATAIRLLADESV